MPGMRHGPSARACYPFACSLRSNFQLPICTTTLTPPRFTCSGKPDGPSAMCGSMLHKVNGSPAHKGQQSQNCEPKVRLLRTTSHGTLPWQVAKSISLNGMNAFISGLLTASSFLQKPTIDIEAASQESCRSLWHLHFEQCCRQTCVSSYLEGTCHLGSKWYGSNSYAENSESNSFQWSCHTTLTWTSSVNSTSNPEFLRQTQKLNGRPKDTWRNDAL